MTRAIRFGLLALLIGYPMALVALSVADGIAISQDSVSYLSTARSLADGQGLVNFAGEPLTLFPPGLPVVLAFLSLLGPSATVAAAVLNVLCVGLAVAGTYITGRLVLRSGWGALAAAAAVSASGTFTGVHGWLWSEPVFTVLTIGVLAMLVWGIVHERAPWWWVFAAAFLAAGASSVRYVGYVLVPVVALGVWWAARGAGRRVAALRALVAAAIVLIVPVSLAIRNVTVGSGPLGDRYPGVRTVQDSVVDAVRVAGEFVVSPGSSTLGPLVGVLVVAVVAMALWAAAIRRDRSIVLLGVFVVLYAGAVVWSQASTRLDAPSGRLLAPAWPAIAVLLVSGTFVLMARVRRDATTWAAGSPNGAVRRAGARWIVVVCWAVIATLAGLAVLSSARASTRMIEDARGGGLGLVVSAQESALVAAAKALPDAHGFASNDPWTLYLGVGRVPVVYLPPSAAEWPQSRIDRDLGVLVSDVQSGRVTHAVVFASGSATQPLADLAPAGVTASPLLQLPEGTVYRLEPTPGSSR